MGLRSIRPHTPERMTPSSRFVKNGRANPVGIAYWYAATDPETALAEMRPWQGALLTVAELTATRSLRFVDCGSGCPMVKPYNTDFEKYVWNSVGEAFSRPVAPDAIDVAHVPVGTLVKTSDSCKHPMFLRESSGMPLKSCSSQNLPN